MAKAAAKQEKKPEAEAEAEEQPKKKSKLPLIIGLAVVLVAGGGGAAYFLMGKKGGEEHKEVKAQAPKPPVFVPLEAFTVNLAAEQNEQYLQVMATLKVLDAPAGDQVKQYMPEIRHNVLRLLSSKKASEISSGESRDRLAEEIRLVTNNILLAAAGKAPKSSEAEPAPTATPAAEPKPEGADAHGEAAKPQEEAKPQGEAAAAAPAPAAVVPAALKAPLSAAAPDDPVQSVFFTSFIIQ